MYASNVLPSAPPEIETQRGLYPNISSENYADNLRLTKISKIEKEIAGETEHYRLLLKKHKKARKAIHYPTVCFASLTTVLSAGAIATSPLGLESLSERRWQLSPLSWSCFYRPYSHQQKA